MSTPITSSEAWSKPAFEERLREKGRAYHIHHPFNVMLNTGKANREQIRGWVANRFYYQICIPIKDAAILSNCPDRAVRRNWVQRILDHDGYGDDPGGIERWLRLGEAAGLSRDDLENDRFLLPGVRFAVDGYVHFVADRPWIEGVASSLTELSHFLRGHIGVAGCLWALAALMPAWIALRMLRAWRVVRGR